MTDSDKGARGGESQEQRQAGLAPELHNDEQDDHRDQAQQVAEQARALPGTDSPTESTKHRRKGDLTEDSTQDLVDHMRDMEQSGRIDMGAYRGEPNLDDDEDKYARSNKVDDGLPADEDDNR